jgi:hypothetical protein
VDPNEGHHPHDTPRINEVLLRCHVFRPHLSPDTLPLIDLWCHVDRPIKRRNYVRQQESYGDSDIHRSSAVGSTPTEIFCVITTVGSGFALPFDPTEQHYTYHSTSSFSLQLPSHFGIAATLQSPVVAYKNFLSFLFCSYAHI